MFNSKKALQFRYILGLVLGALTLVIISTTIIFPIFDSSIYESSLLECSHSLDTVEKGNLFLEDNKVSLKLKTYLAKQCPSKEVEVVSKSTQAAADLIRDCWVKSGKGKNFLKKQTNTNICLYCGTIRAENEINDFDSKLSKELEDKKYKSLFDSSEISHMNKELLSKETLPKTLDKDTSATVFYFISAKSEEEVSNWEGTKRWFAELFDSTPLESYVGPEFESIGGVFLTTQVQKEDDFSNTFARNCELIIPEKEY